MLGEATLTRWEHFSVRQYAFLSSSPRYRHRRFLLLAELNAAIRALLDELNDRLMRGWGMSRRALFEQLDKPALRSRGPLHSRATHWHSSRLRAEQRRST
jgi:hypothetical protein